MEISRRWSGPALALALLGPVGAVTAQESSMRPSESAMLVGSRIRLAAPTILQGRVKGRLVAEDQSTLTVEIDDRVPVRVPREAITSLDISTARQRQWRKGALIGVAVGAATIAALADDGPYCNPDSGFCMSRGEGAAAGAVVGALYGAGIGALIKSDRWSPLSGDHVRASLSAAPGRGVRASVSFAF